MSCCPDGAQPTVTHPFVPAKLYFDADPMEKATIRKRLFAAERDLARADEG
jgi:hypothetical protein